MENAGGGRDVELVFKCPTFAGEHCERLPLSSSVLAVKTQLHARHPLRPVPATQRLIFAGRILNDDERLEHILPPTSVRPLSLAPVIPVSLPVEAPRIPRILCHFSTFSLPLPRLCTRPMASAF